MGVGLFAICLFPQPSRPPLHRKGLQNGLRYGWHSIASEPNFLTRLLINFINSLRSDTRKFDGSPAMSAYAPQSNFADFSCFSTDGCIDCSVIMLYLAVLVTDVKINLFI